MAKLAENGEEAEVPQTGKDKVLEAVEANLSSDTLVVLTRKWIRDWFERAKSIKAEAAMKRRRREGEARDRKRQVNGGEAFSKVSVSWSADDLPGKGLKNT